jgi:hypothetical protein
MAAPLGRKPRSAAPSRQFVRSTTARGSTSGNGHATIDDRPRTTDRLSSSNSAAPSQACPTRDWLKVKCWRARSVVIGGVEFDADGRLEAVLVGTPHDGALRYQGRVELALGKMGEWRAHGVTPRARLSVLRHATFVQPQWEGLCRFVLRGF